MTDVSNQGVSPGREHEHRVRATLAVVLVVLSAIGALASSIAFWVRTTALDTDAFMEVVEPIVTSEGFTEQLSLRLSDSVIEALNLEGVFEARFSALDEFLGEKLIEALDPSELVLTILAGLDIPRFADLATPLSSAVNESVAGVIDGLVRSEGFQTAVPAVIRRGHETAVKLATEDEANLPNLEVRDGEVWWNVIPLVVRAIERVIEEGILPEGADIELPDLSDNPLASIAIGRLDEALDVSLPEDFGQVVVMTEDQFDRVQTATDVFNRLVWMLAATTVVLIIASVAVSPSRRRTIVQLGLGVGASVVLASLVVDRIIGAMQESFDDPGAGSAFGAVADLVVASLREVWVIIAFTSVAVALVALVVGRLENRALRRTPGELDRFVVRYFDWIQGVLLVLALFVLWLGGLGPWTVAGVVVAVGGASFYMYTARSAIEGQGAPEAAPVDEPV